MQEKSWHKIPNFGKNFHFATCFLVEREDSKAREKNNIRIIQRKKFSLFFGSSKRYLLVLSLLELLVKWLNLSYSNSLKKRKKKVI